MGMDVIGVKPTAEVGEYFRNNVWWWRPLWMYCEHVAPALCAKVKYAQTNDGDGLDAEDAIALGKILKAEVKQGNTKRYAEQRQKQLDAIPDLKCEYCNGTGDRKDLGPPEWKKHCGGCNACHGKGTVRPYETWYAFEVENVKKFAAFLVKCGGFKIW